jgi:hypothetical protein
VLVCVVLVAPRSAGFVPAFLPFLVRGWAWCACRRCCRSVLLAERPMWCCSHSMVFSTSLIQRRARPLRVLKKKNHVRGEDMLVGEIKKIATDRR